MNLENRLWVSSVSNNPLGANAMIIDCPWCGKRDVREFTYQGDGNIKRPAISDVNVDEFNAYVYDRENPAGDHLELWQHSGGCRSHLLVSRNTLTHQIASCETVGPWADKSGRAGK